MRPASTFARNPFLRILASAVLLTLFLPAFIIPAAASDREVFTDGDWQYTVSGKKANIIGYLGSDSEITVPAKIGKYAVKEFFINLEHDETVRTIRFEEGIETIRYSSCRYMEALETVVFPESLKEIQYEAFFKCPNIREVKIPASVTVVDDRVFQDSAFFNDPENWENGMLYAGDVLLKARSDLVSEAGTVRKGTRLISAKAFSGFLKMTSVELPSSLEYIGNGAFGQTGLTSVTIPANVREIQQNAFMSNHELRTVEFMSGSKLQKIGVGAFQNCTLLNHLTLPAGLRTIEDSAFSSCSWLEDIVLPEGITHIGRFAFKETRAMNNAGTTLYIGSYLIKHDSDNPMLTIREGTTAITSEAVSFCSRLSELTIPKSVTLIEPDAFYVTNNIRKITYGGSESAWKKLAGSAFEYCKNLKVICLEKDTHEHVFSEWSVDRAPTCEKDGKQTRVCEICGKKETASIDPTGHQFKNGVCVLCGLAEDGVSGEESESGSDPGAESSADPGTEPVDISADSAPESDPGTESSEEPDAESIAEETEEESVPVSSEPPQSVEESGTDLSDDPAGQHTQPLPFIIGGAAVLIAAAAVVTVLVIRKKRV